VKSSYPIVKLDRTIVTNILPLFMNKGIFNNYKALPDKAGLILNECHRLNLSELDECQERKLLSSVGMYKTNNYVVRDYGNYAIKFSAKMYIDYLEETETKIEDELLRSEYTEERIREALDKIKLYKLAHKLSLIILSEVYQQQGLVGVYITKQKILDYLGYSADERHIYEDISDAIFSLRWLTYQIFEYQTKVRVRQEAKTIGNFIYNIREDTKSYTLSINQAFVGCVEHLLSDQKYNKAERKELFAGGYISYPTALLTAAKDYSSSSYLLSNFLISEKGNYHLNGNGYKVVAFRVSRFMEVMNIQHSRAANRKSVFIEELENVDVIEKTSPTIAELKQLTPSKLEDQLLYIYLNSSVKDLNEKIKSAL
jgi:hypothetical protein